MSELLQQKHLVPYLAHQLFVWYKVGDQDGVHVLEVDGFTSEEVCILTTEHNIREWVDYNLIKPILRPMNQLIEEITHEGKTFIPLIELYKISCGNQDGDNFDKGDIEDSKILEIGVREMEFEAPCYFFEYETYVSQIESFSFKGGDFNRHWMVNRSKFGGIQLLIVDNQQLLHETLREWNFDVDGLIEKGLATKM